MTNTVTDLLPHEQGVEYDYTIKTLLNTRRAITQEYRRLEHKPDTTPLQIAVLRHMYWQIHDLEGCYRLMAGYGEMRNPPKWVHVTTDEDKLVYESFYHASPQTADDGY